MNEYIGSDVAQLSMINENLKSFCDQVIPMIQSSEKEWQTEIKLLGGDRTKILMCRGVTLPAHA
ncbi:MAG: hypothetical protein GWN00_12365, partial [Aliifodinibius sp.]|nr:hypothetical protein [Fodinibius sp.]NIY25572.1 hypothetical protein [Fodinibius sp.]